MNTFRNFNEVKQKPSDCKSLQKKETQRDYNEKEKEWEKLKTKKRPSEMKTRISMKLNEKLKANNEQWTKICLLKHKIFV